VPADPKKEKEKIKKPKTEGGETNSTARVTVELPSDAKMWVDNVPCPLTSGTRSFATPALAGNQQYYYNLKVEIVRDGRTISETQRIVLTPGQETRVDFNNSAVIGTASR
jgi:uncharacterized protein (TIGR03000 family)